MNKVDRLKDLADLKKTGTITEEEFIILKTEIMNSQESISLGDAGAEYVELKEKELELAKTILPNFLKNRNTNFLSFFIIVVVVIMIILMLFN
jgi:hypothetical protein